MASMASPCIRCYSHENYNRKLSASSSSPIIVQQQQPQKSTDQVGRREIILRSSEIAVLGAIFHFSRKKPDYLGVQKNPPGLALCPATNNCLSTSENRSDLNHYAPPWNYNPEGGRGSKKPVGREVAVQEPLEVTKTTKPDNFTPRVAEKTDDYVRVEYEALSWGLWMMLSSGSHQERNHWYSIDQHPVWGVLTSMLTEKELRH